MSVDPIVTLDNVSDYIYKQAVKANDDSPLWEALDIVDDIRILKFGVDIHAA